MKPLRICTRGSRLALWQAEWVKTQLLRLHPRLIIEMVIIKTQGDKILDRPLAEIGGKGLFLKELEEALIAGEADLAVHSMKDVPAEIPDGLSIPVITQREDPRDGLVSPKYRHLDALPPGAKVGTSSLRRACQLLKLRPDLQIEPIRGNVETRLRKVQEGQFDATLMAMAGLRRLDLVDQASQVFTTEEILPAVAQGALGIEIRSQDTALHDMIQPLQHQATALCVQAERAALAQFEGNCQIPVAGYAVLNGDQLDLDVLLGDLETRTIIRKQMHAPQDQAQPLGFNCANWVLQNGGKELLERIKN